MQTRFISRATAWAELNTVTSFDAGTTHPVDSMSEKKLGVQDDRSFSPSSLLVESLIEHLCRLLETDPSNQRNLYKLICGKLHQMKLIDQTYSLEEFESLRSYYQKALLHLVTVAKSTVNANETTGIVKLSNTSIDISSSALKEEQLLHWSRYSTDYVELKFIAKGGFGQVFRVRNKLDGEEYAVKKIFLRYRNLNSFYRNIQEVKLLAKLNHPNIVSYKAAWLEPLYSFTTQHVSPQESDLEDGSNISDASHPFVKPALNNVETEESSSIIFKENDSEKKTDTSVKEADASEKCAEKSNSMHIHKRIISEVQRSCITSSSGASSMFRSEVAYSTKDNYTTQELSGEDGNVCVKALRRDTPVCRFMMQAENLNQESNFQHEWAVLYIQMQLCSSTLRDWLNERNARGVVDMKESLRIFHDIVLGVHYIHSQGIVHHDMKPNNVFVNGADASQIRVGDFGLACLLHHSSDDVTLITSHNHKTEFGTKLYAAPEQLEGKCDIKSDIYSLGIILLELLCPFRTDMERSLVITKLRNGVSPQEMDIQYPELMHLIKNLMSREPQERPSAQDLLLTLEKLTKNIPCENLPKNDEYCKEFIDQLREELLRKDQEIEELRKKVLALESSSKN